MGKFKRYHTPGGHQSKDAIVSATVTISIEKEELVDINEKFDKVMGFIYGNTDRENLHLALEVVPAYTFKPGIGQRCALKITSIMNECQYDGNVSRQAFCDIWESGFYDLIETLMDFVGEKSASVYIDDGKEKRTCFIKEALYYEQLKSQFN